jgi:hypothetical protein
MSDSEEVAKYKRKLEEARMTIAAILETVGGCVRVSIKDIVKLDGWVLTATKDEKADEIIYELQPGRSH